MNHIRSGGRIDGDGGVVDRRVEDDPTTWQDISKEDSFRKKSLL